MSGCFFLPAGTFEYPNAWMLITALFIPMLFLGNMLLIKSPDLLSRTVEVQANQKIIDTGLYGVVRHPMYTATIILFLSIPLVLGSWISFIIFCIYPAIIVLRIRNEEKVHEEGLEGYTEYQKKVKYKIIPFIW